MDFYYGRIDTGVDLTRPRFCFVASSLYSPRAKRDLPSMMAMVAYLFPKAIIVSPLRNLVDFDIVLHALDKGLTVTVFNSTDPFRGDPTRPWFNRDFFELLKKTGTYAHVERPRKKMVSYANMVLALGPMDPALGVLYAQLRQANGAFATYGGSGRLELETPDRVFMYLLGAARKRPWLRGPKTLRVVPLA